MTSSTLASTDDTKVCSKCRVAKSRTAFHRAAQKRDGLNAYCKPCNQSQSSAWRAANPHQAATIARRYELRRLYGLSEADVGLMSDAQSGSCAICRDPFTSTPFVDHCHRTGAVRALTCRECNTALGMMQDDPTRLEAAAAYLRLHASTLDRTTDDAEH